jgi:hypothetical protein
MNTQSREGQEAIERAAETLCRITEIPSLRGGVVAFNAYALEGGWWYPSAERFLDTWANADMVWTPMPDEPDIAECMFKLDVALDDWHQDRLEMVRHVVNRCDERGLEVDESFREMLDKMEAGDFSSLHGWTR